MVVSTPNLASQIADRGSSFLTYSKIVDRIWEEMQKETNLAPIIIAGLRELRLFPEFRDATILLLDEIHVTGSSPFDELLKNEMNALANSLLGVSDD